jgi:hypothetical protein
MPPQKKYLHWPITLGLILAILISAQIASANLTFTGTNITGSSNVIIDATGTISIGTSTATAITIGNTNATTTFFGNVGIGTTRPSAALSVSVSSSASVSVEAMRIMNSGSYDASFLYFPRSSDATRGLMIGHQATPSDAGANYANAGVIRAAGGVSQSIELQAGLDLSNVTGTIMLQPRGGNVGIGTNSPGYQLTLEKSDNTGASVNNPTISVANTLATQGDGASTYNLSNIRMIAGNGTVDARLQASYDSVFSGGAIGSITNHDFKIYTNGMSNPRLYVKNTGNVGIGTTAPSTTLQVAGASSTIMIGTASLPGCIEVGNSNGTAGINYVTFLNGVMTATTTKPSACQ